MVQYVSGSYSGVQQVMQRLSNSIIEWTQIHLQPKRHAISWHPPWNYQLTTTSRHEASKHQCCKPGNSPKTFVLAAASENGCKLAIDWIWMGSQPPGEAGWVWWRHLGQNNAAKQDGLLTNHNFEMTATCWNEDHIAIVKLAACLLPTTHAKWRQWSLSNWGGAMKSFRIHSLS